MDNNNVYGVSGLKNHKTDRFSDLADLQQDLHNIIFFEFELLLNVQTTIKS